MAANRRTVGPKSGGGWEMSGPRDRNPTQQAAIIAARRDLLANGGGELVVKGRDGRVRMQSTLGRPDPRRSKG
jgi:hypothetical protein